MSIPVNYRNMACIDCRRKMSDDEVGDFRICIFPGACASFCRIKRELEQHHRPNIGGTETVETKDLPVDLNGLQTETCILEFVCEVCMSKRQATERYRLATVLRDIHKSLHPEIVHMWRQYPPSAKKLHWEDGALIRQLIRHGAPYLTGLTVIDGREDDFFMDQDRVGLVDPSVMKLSGGLPASYRMFVKRNCPNAMDLLVRYLRLTDFINCVFVYRLKGPKLDALPSALERCIVSLAEEYHVQITEPEQDKTVLVAVLRQLLVNKTDDLLDQIENGCVTAHLVPQHLHYITECLMKHCHSLDLVQPPTPISSTEYEAGSQVINVNCHRVENKGLYGFVRGPPLKLFYIRPRNLENPPKQALFVPMRFNTERHAATANGNNTDYELNMLTPAWDFTVSALAV